MQVVLSRFVTPDLSEIGDYIAKHNPDRARTFLQELRGEIAELGRNPFLHRLRPEFGKDKRIMPYYKYLVLFRVVDNRVLVDRVVSGYRDIQKLPS